MKTQLLLTLADIASPENLLEAWKGFLRGKRTKPDVQEFALHLMDNIFSLHRDLVSGAYRHGPYQPFNICDPKPRKIHKAPVRDRLLHHAIYRKLYPFFDRTFTTHSYSCRIGKGTHKALNRFAAVARKESSNHTKTIWVLKCDVRKFFASIDHGVVLNLLQSYIPGEQIMRLLGEIVGSFSSAGVGVGLPLGNLTSQLFANVYLNEFDQFVKHRLKARHYIRYADDFVLFSRERERLEVAIPRIRGFLREQLRLDLHPDKVSIRTLTSGVDFLGWVHFPDHRVLRTTTRRRMLRRLDEGKAPETLASYLGLLGHGNTYQVSKEAIRRFHSLAA